MKVKIAFIVLIKLRLHYGRVNLIYKQYIRHSICTQYTPVQYTLNNIITTIFCYLIY